MNKVTLEGKITKYGVNTSYSKEGLAIAKYTLAVKASEKSKKINYIKCVAFGTLAEIATETLKANDTVKVEGSLSTGSYTNKAGQTIYTVDVQVSKQFKTTEATNASKPWDPSTAQNKIGNINPIDVPNFMDIPDGIGEDLFAS